ncbi:MAG: cellulose-binding protein [Hydrococcus sp. Prado102]|jgi:hypothetical protein|nr:cellulose-binding protein [Hydrococcus sp. Prado102]
MSKKTKRIYLLIVVFFCAVAMCFLAPALSSRLDFIQNAIVQKTAPKTIAPNQNQSDRLLGTNLSQVADWSTQMPFIDAFKSSRSWITQDRQTWSTEEADKLDLDENGWVKSLPSAEDGDRYTSVGTLMFREIPNGYPGGKYIVLYDGEGTIEYDFDAKKDEAASRAGRDVINVTPSEAGIWLKITRIDPNNYLRNIRVIPAAFETSYQKQIFNPDFIERVKDFKVFRFMEWMDINNSDGGQWRDRPTLESARYSKDGVPVEIMVELANRTNIDPWFCMPHMATDEYIAKFAQYVKDHLEAERKVYVEYSNEVWNAMFEQHGWVAQQAKTQGIEQWIDWYSQRTTEIMQIWDRVFGEDKDRIVGVMAGQSANAWLLSRALSYEWSDNPLSHQEYGIDAITIAPYFGYYFGLPEHQAQIEAWTAQGDRGLDLIFEEISQGGALDNGAQNGALQQAYEQIKTHTDLAQQENLQLLAYEGGQHLAGVGSVANSDRITKLFIGANRDSRMGDIYRDYIQTWFELGGGLFVNYNDIAQPSRWGSWGLLESVEQKSSPKYDAVLEALKHLSSN